MTTAVKDIAFCLGLDGCRGGWVAARAPRAALVDAPEFQLFDRIEAFMADSWSDDALVAVDMPIGLAEADRRGCDQHLRRALGRPRASSVFAAPRRPMLSFASYPEANAWGKAQGAAAGGGLSKQAWNITPKIRELDAVISPALQARLFEAHPEAAFLRLSGGQVPPPKKTAEGAEARMHVLEAAGFAHIRTACADFLAAHRGAVKQDDLLDAAALSLTAQARISGAADRYSDDRRDARGLIMEIWG